MSSWSPRHYLRFADERARPARDLLSQVPLSSPGRIYDLGCGPGNSTALLADAYPDADIVGVDNSEEMLAEARRVLPSRTFVFADLAQWLPEESPDLLFSNAAFQWVPDHAAVMKRLTATLAPGGVLAVQMPDNLGEPSHRLMLDTAACGPWSGKLANADEAREASAGAPGLLRAAEAALRPGRCLAHDLPSSAGRCGGHRGLPGLDRAPAVSRSSGRDGEGKISHGLYRPHRRSLSGWNRWNGPPSVSAPLSRRRSLILKPAGQSPPTGWFASSTGIAPQVRRLPRASR